jgi:hypothetical protein
VIVCLSAANSGVLASPRFAGDLGADLLRKFRVIFDYSRNRMVLEPNRTFGRTFEFDMAGMFVTAEGTNLKTYRVHYIVKNSPAEKAAIKTGDVI